MAKVSVSEFSGIAPKIPPRYLKEGYAQTAKNCEAVGNSLKPLKGLSAAIKTLSTSATKTIYKFGQDNNAEDQHWFSWDTDVDVCRSQIAGDTNEWTFYTGDGAPKATYAGIALGAGKLPVASIPLGLPAPATAPTATAGEYVADTEPAELYMSSAVLKNFTTDYGLDVSLDDEQTYTNVALADTEAATVAAALNTVSGISAVVEGGGVEVKTDAGGREVSLYIRYAPDTWDAVDARGTDQTRAKLQINASMLAELAVWYNERYNDNDYEYAVVVQVYTRDASGNEVTAFNKTYPKESGFTLESDINNSYAFSTTADGGGGFYIEDANTTGAGSYVRLYAYQTRSGKKMTIGPASGQDSAQGTLILGPDRTLLFNVRDDILVAFSPPDYFKVELPGTTPAAIASALDPINGLSATHDGTNVTVKTDAYGANAYVVIAYRTTRTPLSAYGKTLDTGTKETRVYVFTWVNKVAGFEMESAPSPASESIDVYADQDVTLSGFPAIPAGYAATNRRVYRSVDGTYLFVKEFGTIATTFVDDLEADDLGEEIPSLNWAMPPAALKGLVNLPNGIMAGFVGRDIYFCEPYKPYAWSETYIQTVDYPIVGLGVLDTTLVVLTRGTPYFVQGSHPDSMVVVKTDIEQSCLSKRSIVSIAGAVVYASPDGLVSVAPGGSKILSAELFKRDQWQAMFAPASIHAFEHDLKYFAFYANGASRGGFILDFATGSLTLHSVYAACGFSELRSDTLFVCNGATITRWGGGSALTYTWRSKRTTFPHYIGFSCAQVEAEAYPLTFRIYANQILAHEQEVTNRYPFRLPAVGGRDWEFEIEANTEVFNAAYAQAMEEIASV
ncbi:MAG: hypothetical protein EOM22_00200 [Gammaproteobacteria bacterium]|nr:hypothetical protein [Gammaproteobacteria bacterium]